MRIVEVTWVDSSIYRGWTAIQKLRSQVDKGSLMCKTVGYVFSDTDEELSLTMSLAWEYSEDEEAASQAELLPIPRVSIESIEELRKKLPEQEKYLEAYIAKPNKSTFKTAKDHRETINGMVDNIIDEACSILKSDID